MYAFRKCPCDFKLLVSLYDEPKNAIYLFIDPLTLPYRLIIIFGQKKEKLAPRLLFSVTLKSFRDVFWILFSVLKCHIYDVLFPI